MNCKPGDLAIVIYHGVNYGRLVKVIRLLTESEVYDFGFIKNGDGASWLVEAIGDPLLGIRTLSEHRVRPFADSSLRPIRNNDGEDETLTCAGKPAKEIA